MTHEQLVNEMVNRFLGWKLPSDFSPDGGISFDKNYNPTGTNLLNATQAKAMFEYVIGQFIATIQPLAQIDHDADMDRYYIPMPAGWEMQTKGKGSSFRLCNTKTHERVHILDERLQPVLEQMAREIHANAKGNTVEQ